MVLYLGPSDLTDVGHVQGLRAELDAASGLVLDPDKLNKIFIGTIYPTHTTVMQCAYIDPTTKNIYVSQATTGTVGSRETTIVSKLTPSGTLLASMQLTDAGHGTAIFTETVGASTWLWMNFTSYVDASTSTPLAQNLVRIPWTDGATYTWASTQVNTNVINKFTTNYTLAVPDVQNDVVLMRETSGSTETQYLRKLSELKAGTNNKITGNVVTSTATDVVQGFGTDGTKSFLRYLGHSDSGVQQAQLQVYSWTTLALTHTINLETMRFEADNSVEESFSEPEGLSIHRDTRGRLYIIVGMSSGSAGNRRHRLYALTMENAHPMVGEQALVTRTINPWRTDRSARSINGTSTKLIDNNMPGWYYLSTANMGDMTDKPADAAAAGYFLENSGWNAGRSACVQKLYRSSLAADGSYYRIVDFVAQTFSPWYRYDVQATGAESYATRARTATQSVGNASYTDILWDTDEASGGGLTYTAGTGVFTVTEAGRYRVSTQVSFAVSNTTGQRVIQLLIGSTVVGQSAQIKPADTSYPVTCVLSKTINCAVGDTIKVRAYQSSGGTINVGGQQIANFVSIDKI